MTLADRPLTIADLIVEAAPADDRPAAAIWRCAVHEAAHAVAAAYAGNNVQRVSIISRGSSGGQTVMLPASDGTMSPDALDAVIIGALGGRAAEDVLGLGLSTGAYSDLGEATALATAKRASFGMGGSLVRRAPMDRAYGLLEGDPALRAEIEEDLQRLYQVAVGIIRRHQALVEGVAQLLVAQRVVDENAFRRLVEVHDRAIAVADLGGHRHG